MFFTYLGLAEGKSLDDIQKKIKNDLATAVMGSWTVWIPAHTINFKFVPTSQRLLYINTIQASPKPQAPPLPPPVLVLSDAKRRLASGPSFSVHPWLQYTPSTVVPRCRICRVNTPNCAGRTP